MNKQMQELKKLRRLIIHNHKTIEDDQVWYQLARKETKAIARLPSPMYNKELKLICSSCFPAEPG